MTDQIKVFACLDGFPILLICETYWGTVHANETFLRLSLWIIQLPTSGNATSNSTHEPWKELPSKSGKMNHLCRLKKSRTVCREENSHEIKAASEIAYYYTVSGKKSMWYTKCYIQIFIVHRRKVPG